LTGEGQMIDISMMDSVLSILENAVVRYTVTGEIPTRIGSRHPSIAPFDVFQTKDGWVVIGIGNDSIWKKFCRITCHDKLIEDPLYLTNYQRSKNYEQLEPLINEWTKKQTSQDIVELLTQAGVPAAEVNTMDKIIQDPNVKMRNMFIQMNHPKAGKVTVANSPFRLSKLPNDDITASPLLGEHTEEVLEEIIGMSKKEIFKLREKNII
jgi:CoA:oxalate CoA-transferase